MLVVACSVLTALFTAFAFVGCKKVSENLLPQEPPAEQPAEKPHEHVYTDKFEQDEDGHWKVCTDENCPDKDKEPEKIAHIYGAGVKKSDSSCTVRGETEFTCTDCGYVNIEYAPFVHNYQDADTIAPTCTSKGYTIQRCTVCKDEVRTNPTNETGHHYEDSVQTATCTAPEITTYTCEGCGDSYHEITKPAMGHNTENATWTVASETLVSGSQCMYVVTEEAACQNANCSQVITRKVDELIHKGVYSSQVTTPANCSQDGVVTYTCVCGESQYTYTSTFESDAHDWNDGVETNGMLVYTCRHNAAHTKQEVSATKDAATASATIPASALETLNTDTAAEVEVTQNTKMQMDSKVLNAIAGASATTDVTLVAQELDASDLPSGISTARVGDTVYNFDLQNANGDSLFGKDNTIGGKITITVPYQLQQGEDPASITILWLADDGTTKSVPAKYDATTETVSFELDHFSYYTVVRMTAEEICLRDGHQNKVTVVPATCIQGGYTLTICTRCNETTRTNVVAAKGHNHQTTVVAPTCTERGFTRYVCQNAGCNDSYVMNYTAQISHAYQDVVVAPTCTEKGHTAHVCSYCGKTYRDAYVVPNGHTYRNGNCKDCGTKDLTHLVNADNFYFNLINSVVNADGFYVEVDDIQMSGSTSYTGMSGEVSYEVDMYRFMFKVDDNGYIVGQGEGKMKAEMTATRDGEQPETEKIEMDMVVVFQNGKMYSFQKQTERIGDFTSVADWYIMDTQENMDLDSLRAMYQSLDNDSILAIIGGVMGKENNPLNTAMANVVNYLFDKTETDDGFTYVLNYEKIPELYTAMTEDSVAVAFDKVFGENAFTKVSEYALAVPAKTVAQVKTDVVKWCLDCGVEITDVYAVIDSFMNAMGQEGDEEFSVSEIISENQNKTVAEVVSEFTGEEMTVENLQGMIQGTLDMLGEMTIADCMAMAVASAGGMGGGNAPGSGISPNPQPNPQPMPEPTPKPMGEELGGGEEGGEESGEGEQTDPMQQQMAQYIAFFGEQLTALVEALSGEGKSAMGFTTDKSGNLMTVSMEFNGFTHSLTVDSMMFVTDEEDAVGEVSIEMEMSGEMTAIVGGSYVADYDEVVSALERSIPLFNIQSPIELIEKYEWYDEDYNEHYEQNEYVMYPTAQGALLAQKFNENHGEPTNFNANDNYNGTPCYSYVLRGYGEWYLLKPEQELQFKTSCNGWREYFVIADYGHGVYYKVYYLQDGTRLNVEFMLEETLNGMYKGDSHRKTIYYNVTEKTFSLTNPHNYVLFAQDIPDECEEHGYKAYRCSVCAHQERDSLYKWHEDVEWRYQLVDGAESCEDGVVEVEYCYDCNRVVHTWEVSKEIAQEHPTRRTKMDLFGADENTCEEHLMVKEACACGKEEIYSIEDHYEGNYTFENVGYYNVEDGKQNHYCEVFRCAVTDCAYTYVKENYYVDNAANCTRTWYYTTYFDVKNLPEEPTSVPTQYAVSKSYTETGSWHATKSTSTWQGNIKTVQYVCENCDELTRVEKYECFNVRIEDGEYNYSANREIYWFDYQYGSGSRYEFDVNCNRTRYDLRWDEEKNCIVESESYNDGVWHCTYEQMIAEPTCTQFGYRTQECYACEYKFGLRSAPRGHEYDGGYCRECGMSNETYADGAFIMEDKTENGIIKVGYFNKYNRHYDIRVFFNYGEDNQVNLDMNEWSHLINHNKTFRSAEEAREDYYFGHYPWGLECGEIALNMDVLQTVMNAQNVALDTLTIVISSSYNYETEEGYEGRALEYGVTFEIGKSGTYALNALCYDYTEYEVGQVWEGVMLAEDMLTLVLNDDFTYTLTVDSALYGANYEYSGEWQSHGNLIRLFLENDEFFVIYCDGETVRLEKEWGTYGKYSSWYWLENRYWMDYNHYVLSK